MSTFSNSLALLNQLYKNHKTTDMAPCLHVCFISACRVWPHPDSHLLPLPDADYRHDMLGKFWLTTAWGDGWVCFLLSVVRDAVLASGYNIASILLTCTFDVWVHDRGDSFYNTNHVNNTCVCVPVCCFTCDILSNKNLILLAKWGYFWKNRRF